MFLIFPLKAVRAVRIVCRTCLRCHILHAVSMTMRFGQLKAYAHVHVTHPFAFFVERQCKPYIIYSKVIERLYCARFARGCELLSPCSELEFKKLNPIPVAVLLD
jgi:hypothetical protein